MKKPFRRYTVLMLLSVFICAICPPCSAYADSDIFYDDFSGSNLNPDKWLIAQKNWGGTVTTNGKTADYNGGVIAENVSIRDGNLILTGYGNQYSGAVKGINRDGSRRTEGKRCGAAIATRDYYASGSYEIRAKIAPELGCCSAMWTFEYEEHEQNDGVQIVNHEIDIEFPGRDASDQFSLSHALCTTWQTEDDYKTKSAACGNQADGEFHTYRFDWHTGNDTETPRVEFYFDEELTYTAYSYIPTNESRFWLGLWFPKNWAGTPDFDTAEFEIDYVRITPFHESGDTPQHETYPDSGWAPVTAELPKGWLLWHSYSSYSALDSKLFLKAPDDSVTEISGDFYHAMNGSFGQTPDQITFMAIDRLADEWDIYLYQNGEIKNLTPNSGCRNEDPKWSPDAKNIVFKRGKWDQHADDFVYDLALIQPDTGAVTMLTNDSVEEAMPCFSSDGRYIYYAAYENGIGSICRLDLSDQTTEAVFCEDSVTAYYPVTFREKLYFTKWLSAENRCDQIMCFNGTNTHSMPFNSEQYDCSDACPVDQDTLIYSSTANGGYDLYYYDGGNSILLRDYSTEQNDLGAGFYSYAEYEAYLEKMQTMGDINADGIFDRTDIALLQNYLLTGSNVDVIHLDAADFNQDHKLNAIDLSMMKHAYT